MPGVSSDKITGLNTSSSDKTKGLTTAMLGGRPGEDGSTSDHDMSNEKGKGKRPAEEELEREQSNEEGKGKRRAVEESDSSDSDYIDPDYNDSDYNNPDLMSEKRRGKMPAIEESASDNIRVTRQNQILALDPALDQEVDSRFEADLERAIAASREDAGQTGESSRTAELRGPVQSGESSAQQGVNPISSDETNEEETRTTLYVEQQEKTPREPKKKVDLK